MADTPIDIAAAIAAIDSAAAPLLAARQALESAVAREAELTAQVAHAVAQRDELLAGGDVPALPRQRKLWGVARNIDGVPAVYTEAEMLSAQRHAHALGVEHGRTLGPREPGIGYTAADGLYDDEQNARRLGEHDRAEAFAAERRALTKRGRPGPSPQCADENRLGGTPHTRRDP